MSSTRRHSEPACWNFPATRQSSQESASLGVMFAMGRKERDVTTLLRAIEGGDERARAELFAVLYDELHARAARLPKARSPHETFRTTAIVHETYVRMVRERDAG